jgi:hypothetical protein
VRLPADENTRLRGKKPSDLKNKSDAMKGASFELGFRLQPDFVFFEVCGFL